MEQNYQFWITSALAASFAAVFSSPASAQQIDFREVDAASANCTATLSEKKFDVLRGKVRLHNESPAQPPNRKPTPSELQALRQLFHAQVRCDVAVSRAINRAANIQGPDYWFDPAANESNAGLALLMSGEITYKELADWNAARAAALIQKVEASRKKTEEEQRAQQRYLLLSCIAERPDEARGVEFQYQVDTEANTVWANRGSGPPSNVQIGSSQITFDQGPSRVSISRLNGTFSVVMTAGGVFTGKCAKATGRSF